MHGFVPSRDARFYLLQAHRQPLAANVAAHWIETFTAQGDLVIDPFAASDAVIRVALERGRRILAADSNPLVAWATRLQATLPSPRDIQGALARLGDTRKENEPLRTHLEKMYASQCANCGSAVIVDYFYNRLDAGKTLLAEKVYACAKCGARRDDATEADRQRAADAAPRGLTYHLLVQRLIADDPAHSALVKKLLALYTQRNLAALAALTQKLDAEFRDDPARNLLAALMLHALDVGTSLYPAPDALPSREVPPEFVEMNIWRALEIAARGLSEHPPALRLAANPAAVIKATTPTAFIGAGGARYLAENATNANAALVLSSPARLDPTFWELSFLWTRWLLGNKAASSLESLLEENSQRWSWYGDKLTAALNDTTKLMRPDARFVVAFPSGSHAMIEALMLAASPNFALEDFAFRPARGATRSTEFGAVRGDYQVIWQRAMMNVSPTAASQASPKIRNTALRAAIDILNARNEPLVYSWLHHAALDKLAREGMLAETMQARYREGDNAFQFLRHRMEEGFKEGYIHDLDHWTDKERRLWMTRERDETRKQLSDRIEQAVAEILRARERLNTQELEKTISEKFAGLLTPEIELVELAAQAYADLNGEELVWRKENLDTEQAISKLSALGNRFGYQVIPADEPFDLIWRVEKIIPQSARGSVQEQRIFEDMYGIAVRPRADFHALVSNPASPLHGLLVIPEPQVALTRERLRRDPRWLKKLERAGWEFLRMPFVEQLLQETWTERPEFQLIWGLEPPIARGKEQMELF